MNVSKILRNAGHLSLCTCVVAVTLTACSNGRRIQRNEAERRTVSLFLDPGTSDEADIYYTKLGTTLHFGNNAPPADMQALMKYSGYEPLKIEDIERLPSADLMSFDSLRRKVINPAEFQAAFDTIPFANGDILAARFFAPKITDVSGTGAQALGWRKVVRLKARNGSPAAGDNITDIYLLFNFFQPRDTPNQPPFGGHSVNNQAMLVQSSPRTAWWLVFGPIPQGATRINFLTASFDARDPSIGPQGKYFVPRACAVCHGGTANPKLNFFDTDHWLDRAGPDDDFPDVGAGPQPVLFDGGKDETTSRFSGAFEVFRQLNTAVRDQNAAAGGSTLHRRSVENWIQLHSSSVTHVAPTDRGIPPVNPANPTWTRSEPDSGLIRRLNRYCYRCHSSIRYNVFDRPAVLARRDDILDRLQSSDTTLFMPQDRTLDPKELNKLMELLKALQ